MCKYVYYFIEAHLRRFSLADILLSLLTIHLSLSVNWIQNFTFKKCKGFLSNKSCGFWYKSRNNFQHEKRQGDFAATTFYPHKCALCQRGWVWSEILAREWNGLHVRSSGPKNYLPHKNSGWFRALKISFEKMNFSHPLQYELKCVHCMNLKSNFKSLKDSLCFALSFSTRQ